VDRWDNSGRVSFAWHSNAHKGEFQIANAGLIEFQRKSEPLTFMIVGLDARPHQAQRAAAHHCNQAVRGPTPASCSVFARGRRPFAACGTFVHACPACGAQMVLSRSIAIDDPQEPHHVFACTTCGVSYFIPVGGRYARSGRCHTSRLRNGMSLQFKVAQGRP
jgi:hypothetical protein